MYSKLKNLLFILILGSVCTALLIGIRSYTLPKIERYRELKLKSSILDACGIDSQRVNLDDAFSRFIREKKKQGFTYYLSPDNKYIFIFEGRGLWGMITGGIALNPDLQTIENIRVVSQEETPGLGGRIVESSFLDQFKKKKVSPLLTVSLRKKATHVNEVDAITGATMTSKVFVDMINESVINFRKIME